MLRFRSNDNVNNRTVFFPFPPPSLYISIAILTCPARPEEKAWGFAGRVTGRLTHLLGRRIGPRVRQLQRRRTARLSLSFTRFLEYRNVPRASSPCTTTIAGITRDCKGFTMSCTNPGRDSLETQQSHLTHRARPHAPLGVPASDV